MFIFRGSPIKPQFGQFSWTVCGSSFMSQKQEKSSTLLVTSQNHQNSLIQNLTFLTFGQYIKWFPKKVNFLYISREFGEVFDNFFPKKSHVFFVVVSMWCGLPSGKLTARP